MLLEHALAAGHVSKSGWGFRKNSAALCAGSALDPHETYVSPARAYEAVMKINSKYFDDV